MTLGSEGSLKRGRSLTAPDLFVAVCLSDGRAVRDVDQTAGGGYQGAEMRRWPCRVAHNDEIAHVYNVGSVVEVSAAIDRGNVV